MEIHNGATYVHAGMTGMRSICHSNRLESNKLADLCCVGWAYNGIQSLMCVFSAASRLPC